MDTVRSWLAAGLIAATFGIGGGALAATVQVKAGDGTPDAGGCGTRANPCDTIQAGVDNAEPGDVVNVGKGDYAENVAVATPEITLRGAGTLIGAPDLCAPTSGHIDTCLGIPSDVSCDSRWTIDDDFIPHARSCQWTGAECRVCPPEICPALCEGKIPAALRVEADGVEIAKLRVVGASYVGIGVESGASSVVLDRVSVEGAGDACVAADGDGFVATGARVRSCGGAGIVADGADVVLTRSEARETDGAALLVRGPGAAIDRNVVKRASSACVRVVGDGAAVERNRLTTSSGPGIDARGTRFRVARNPVFGTDG